MEIYSVENNTVEMLHSIANIIYILFIYLFLYSLKMESTPESMNI